MREKKGFSERTRLHDSNVPKRKYILAFEGKDTEPIYFDMVDRKKKELGINSLVELSPIVRSFSEDGWSHPKKIAETIVDKLKIQSSGKYPINEIIDWIVEYLYSIGERTIQSKTIKDDLQDICENELDMVLDNRIDYEKLADLIECILDRYNQRNCVLSFEELQKRAKEIIQENNITYDPEFDHLCLIVDRDRRSFKDEQYNEVLTMCVDNRIDLYISNPCFEF